MDHEEVARLQMPGFAAARVDQSAPCYQDDFRKVMRVYLDIRTFPVVPPVHDGGRDREIPVLREFLKPEIFHVSSSVSAGMRPPSA